ncbi:MAG: hypothetical protein QMD88_09175, partial [Coprothermobacterota bacterium]|nr:hypothetical protein [Coprothermobacterota bacterium]
CRGDKALLDKVAVGIVGEREGSRGSGGREEPLFLPIVAVVCIPWGVSIFTLFPMGIESILGQGLIH